VPPPPADRPTESTPAPDGDAGQLLGLPAAGPGSLAPFGRRLLGIFIDWLVADLVVFLFARQAFGAVEGIEVFYRLFAWIALTVLCLSVVAATFGHYVTGLQLRQVRPGFYPLQVLVRTLLLALVVFAVPSRDGRGFHDVIAGTVLVRR